MKNLEHDRALAWGLNLDDADVTTQDEIDTFRRITQEQFGEQQDGFDFWLDHGPQVLKRYRRWADKIRLREAAEAPNVWTVGTIGNVIYYASTGFEDGLRYTFHLMSNSLTKDQILEGISVAFRYLGPRGMSAIARATRTQAWPAPIRPVSWPPGWAPDADAFRSGADFSTRSASAEDVRMIVAWYERWAGEVPQHVAFLARYRPDVLKAYRDRFEHTFKLLPKQTEPYVQIQHSVQRGFRSGIRDGILLAKGFGMTRNQVLEAITWGTFSVGTDALDLVNEVAAPLLDTW